MDFCIGFRFHLSYMDPALVYRTQHALDFPSKYLHCEYHNSTVSEHHSKELSWRFLTQGVLLDLR